MPRNIYEPLKLNQTNRYAGYQFHARIRMDGTEPSDAFRYVVLTVCEWILKRIPEGDRQAPELQLPPAEKYAEAGNDVFRPYHFSIGYALDITPLMNDGIWAMRIKEPDAGTAEREAVPGRFFTTRVGVRLNEKGYTELGIRIDVTDPASEEKEIDFAFRPGFVRNLFEKPFIRVEQVRDLLYDKAVRVETEEDYRQLVYLLESEDNQMPLAVFTCARKAEDAPDPGDASPDFLRKTQEFFGTPAREAEAEPELFHDPDAFCGKAFGYAVTFVLGYAFADRFRKQVGRSFTDGDILLCGARRFRGTVSAFGCTGASARAREKTFKDAVLAARRYSKHKAPYSYGTVVFEAEARKMEQHARVTELVNSGTMEEKEKIAGLTYEMEMLFGVIDSKDEDIEELRRQKEAEYARGRAFGEGEYALLEEENARLRNELNEKQRQIGRMQGDHQRAREILGVVERVQSVDAMPETNADVVRYFKVVFPDRLGFTERGEAEACRCGLRAEHLWEVLYTVATRMTDVFRNAQENLTEEDVMGATGFDVSFHEGSETRKQREFMRLREDVYEGRDISVEPHLKLKRVKDEPDHQRLHFCYIPELKRIVIGYLGDHLDSAATKYIAKK